MTSLRYRAAAIRLPTTSDLTDSGHRRLSTDNAVDAAEPGRRVQQNRTDPHSILNPTRPIRRFSGKSRARQSAGLDPPRRGADACPTFETNDLNR